MSRLRLSLLLAMLCSCYGLGQGGITPPETVLIPVSTTVTPETTTSPETITTPKTTTTKTTTSSTTPSTTTTTSTTTQSTTTSSTTTTTTTTTTPAPTPAPGPLPPPDQGLWSFTNGTTNATCIVVQFAAQLNVTYTKTVGNVTSLWNVSLNVPANATVSDGNCYGDQWLKLSWLTKNDSTDSNNIIIVYHMNATTKSYGVKNMTITLTPDNFVNGSSTQPIELYHGAAWQTPVSTSYRCKVPTQMNMTSDSTSVVATVTLSRLQEEAYRTKNGTGFSSARECGGGDVPDAVPIAVGCALGGLVVLVLIAYLVGRRRSAARGYLSM